MNSTEIPNWLKQRAFLTPNRIAIKTEYEEISFLTLHQNVLKKANQLSNAGIQQGDVVSVLMKNSVEMVEIIHALKYIGAVTVLLNIKLTGNELEFQVSDSGTKMLLTEDALIEKANEINIKKMLVKDLEQYPEKDCCIQEYFSLDQADTIMYTSGTTGSPKGVIHTYGNHLWSAIGSSLNLGLHQDDCWLLAVPMFHISGLSILYRSVIYGIPAVIHEGFDPKKANAAIINQGVTIMSVVSIMLARMVEELGDETYPDRFRCMLLGGGPAPKPLLENCLTKNIPVFQTYGMTETASQVVTLAPEYSISKLGSAGKPLFPVQIKIEKEGSPAIPNEVGEIVVKAPNVTNGYLNRMDATKTSIVDGWLYTGDIGYLDEEGFLFVMDRRSDLIISGGENIYPAELEAVLLAHPSIIEAGVTGVEDDKWGQVPAAFVRIVDGSNASEAEIIEFCYEKLARYKVPKSIHFVDRLPRNASNKLLRRKLIELLKDEKQ
ncbi:o-succinylbenzoate--CoA ligase [Bacillus sp. REN16]|uniref:o-succinylbenzoate--CoA ligase n=1 Tax=Bacillus sp. REN16 TaxID=2887296 RepID=UPI001E4CFE33|nr:o-succinylbenzoate--CoA ligase [Bacillus sp. REN16]MCC3358055.1 o-succinylbenzoate--CoA ligase [Bacillus sp. REN16]